MATKPGIKTTEFWVTAIAKIAGLLALFGVLSPEQEGIITGNAPMGAEIVTNVHAFAADTATRISGLVVTVAAAFGYANSRGKAKSNE